jgi:hypothetical protein
VKWTRVTCGTVSRSRRHKPRCDDESAGGRSPARLGSALMTRAQTVSCAAARLLRVQRRASVCERRFHHSRPALQRCAPHRHPDRTGEQREATSATRRCSRHRSRTDTLCRKSRLALLNVPLASSSRHSTADYSDGRRGVCLLNIGLPGNLLTDGTLMLSPMRSHNLGGYGFGSGYEPGMGSDTGFQLAARVPLRARPARWRLQGRGLSRRPGVQSPIARAQRAPHAGPLPSEWGLLEICIPTSC